MISFVALGDAAEVPNDNGDQGKNDEGGLIETAEVSGQPLLVFARASMGTGTLLNKCFESHLFSRPHNRFMCLLFFY
jgi:hypothetical protein